MFKILSSSQLGPQTFRLEVEAPLIAGKANAGQFIVLVIDEKAERIPLTLSDWNKDTGSITLIFQAVGQTTRKLSQLKKGGSILHILGPLGHPTAAESAGTVVTVGGGVGIAEVWPVSRRFKEAGNKVIGIIGARSKDLLILEQEMRASCDELYVVTDDGSYGEKGFVTDALKKVLDSGALRNIHSQVRVYAIGPVPMMKAVSEFTRLLKIRTMVSLNPIMVDATGMCGACRCTVAGKTKFACVDGPDFDGHEVDFAELSKRLTLFKEQEQECATK
jgi:ferredoxin--NADP+ reductase